MTDHTIFRVDEQALRLDTQDGVCGSIRATKRNALLVALYLRMNDEDKNRVHEMMLQYLKRHVEKEFARAVACIAEEETQYAQTYCVRRA